jgi:ketosteroid isomerase-like protein
MVGAIGGRVMGTNAETIRGLYESFSNGDVEAVLAAMDDKIHWEEPASVPFENQIGPQAIAENIFGPVTDQVEEFTGTPNEIVDGGDVVCVMGIYSDKGVKTGIELNTEFAHVWRFGPDGNITGFRTYTDTHHWRQVLGVE